MFDTITKTRTPLETLTENFSEQHKEWIALLKPSQQEMLFDAITKCRNDISKLNTIAVNLHNWLVRAAEAKNEASRTEGAIFLGNSSSYKLEDFELRRVQELVTRISEKQKMQAGDSNAATRVLRENAKRQVVLYIRRCIRKKYGLAEDAPIPLHLLQPIAEGIGGDISASTLRQYLSGGSHYSFSYKGAEAIARSLGLDESKTQTLLSFVKDAGGLKKSPKYDPDANVGTQLRYFREKNAISTTELGTRIGLSSSTITNYESSRKINRERRLSLIRALKELTEEKKAQGKEVSEISPEQEAAFLNAPSGGIGDNTQNLPQR